MLPDFPDVKNELDRRASLLIKLDMALSDPIMREIRTTIQHEGDQHTYGTVQGDVRALEYQKIESMMEILKDELPSLSVDQIFERVKLVAEDMTRQMAQGMFNRISEITKETGTSVSAGGRPITLDLFLETIDRMEIDFNEETGEPTFQIVAHPDMMPKFKELDAEFRANPEYQSRHEEIMKRKKEEWHEREARRALVD